MLPVIIRYQFLYAIYYALIRNRILTVIQLLITMNLKYATLPNTVVGGDGGSCHLKNIRNAEFPLY